MSHTSIDLTFEEAKAKRDQYQQMIDDLKPKLRELGIDPDSIKLSRTRKKTQVTRKETKPNPHRVFMSVCLKEGKGMNICNAEWRAKK